MISSSLHYFQIYTLIANQMEISLHQTVSIQQEEHSQLIHKHHEVGTLVLLAIRLSYPIFSCICEIVTLSLFDRQSIFSFLLSILYFILKSTLSAWSLELQIRGSDNEVYASGTVLYLFDRSGFLSFWILVGLSICFRLFYFFATGFLVDICLCFRTDAANFYSLSSSFAQIFSRILLLFYQTLNYRSLSLASDSSFSLLSLLYQAYRFLTRYSPSLRALQ